jgi:hypothetical protein
MCIRDSTILAYFFYKGFNDFSNNYGYTIDRHAHNGSGYSYNENGERVVFPEESAYYALESDVYPVLTIADRLRYAPRGLQLYSPSYGEVSLINVDENYIIEVLKKDKHYFFDLDGKITSYPDSECVLFPSKENRDWTTVDYSKPPRKDLPKGTPVFVSDEIDEYIFYYRLILRYYAGESSTFVDGKKDGGTVRWNHIVPVSKFDFENLTYNPEDDYGTFRD